MAKSVILFIHVIKSMEIPRYLLYGFYVSKYLDDNNDYNGQLLFYTSKNATEWHYANNYRGIKCGDMWECSIFYSCPSGIY